MDVLTKVRNWAAGLADVGVSLAALAIIVEVLGMGIMPFMGDVSVIDNVSSIMSSLGAEGLIGLVAGIQRQKSSLHCQKNGVSIGVTLFKNMNLLFYIT